MVPKKLLEGCYVHSVKYDETSRGVSFSGTLMMDGAEVGFVENDGNGGPTKISLPNPENRQELTKRIKKYLTETNQEDYEHMGEEVFGDALMDIYDFGKVLTDEERWQVVKNNLNPK